ncbi:MAG: alpha-amlyase [Flavobacteriales bacterium]|nr:MAG: alpha-amlyase [Flavobacteriales bacterium]
MKKTLFLIILIIPLSMVSQIDRIEPPNWFTGMKNPQLQLLVYGKNISAFTPVFEEKGIISKVEKAKSKNYLFITINTENLDAGTYNLHFKDGEIIVYTYPYTFEKRLKPEEKISGFTAADAIYLITPDRFANGNVKNDLDKDLLEKTINRDDDYGRHGGDIQGIINHLDYIEKMGFTAIWPSPLLTNDMPQSSYHGYAITDFYKVDPRFGNLEEYKILAEKAKEKGIKLIMDQVANHCGLHHWWMQDLPFEDWLNFQEDFLNNRKLHISNHRRTANMDIYASQYDKDLLNKGWFVDAMPDLNQKNPFLATYIIQNSIWWVETLNLGGIRQDTYPYPDKDFMANWAKAIMTEYPNFNIVGEEWSANPLVVSYWQDGAKNSDGYRSHLSAVMDFPMQQQIVAALNEKEGWDTGLVKMYEGLANDFYYTNPFNIMAFLDNHDMDRVFTALQEDVVNTKMAIAYLIAMPRIPQIYYGTEILMQNTAKPGDHGLIRTDFPGGWPDDKINAFTGEGLTENQKAMQQFVKILLNYRKQSAALKSGKTVHFAPENGIYVLTRISDDETVMVILNKNEDEIQLELDRFSELGIDGKTLRNIITDEDVYWKDRIELKEKGVWVLSTK